ncbi:membrane protein [Phytohabitans aurantiacus]|jgi:predicted anti-sigma-YlaC factor YlaD|uniref:Membrane protein n=2 Tax=Phytohabitans aurantiacus TaxID=3016789 RepID=A0ABQ5QSQ1_9ACTN|nr:membrane protein [Phytohabitans aurantiacus]
MTDNPVMRCDDFRESLSARLDGEDDPAERPATDAHLASCLDCATWFEAAAQVTRLTRTSAVPDDIDLTSTILANIPTPAARPRGRRLVAVLRVLLGALGVAQFLLGAAQISGFAAAAHLHSVTGEPAGHLWHESAAWNVAVGAGFAWIAWRRTRPTGIVPTLTAFVAVLTLLTVNDLISGRVDVARVLSHSIIVAGYAIILYLSRRGAAPSEPPASGSRWRATFEPEPASEPAAPPRLRLIRGFPGPIEARYDDRRAA